MVSTMQSRPNLYNKQELGVSDRCDRCGAQAYVLVSGLTGELMFCAHHYNKINNDKDGKIKLKMFAIDILDNRNQLIDNNE